MNTYIFYITYTDGYTEEFEVTAPSRLAAMEIVANEYEIYFEEVAHVSVELKEDEEEEESDIDENYRKS